MTAYDEDLAYIHDHGYSRIAEGAAASVLWLLPPHASIVELGCGSGVTAARLTDAGPEVLGIEQSGALITLARRRAPRADFRVGSFVSEPIPSATPCWPWRGLQLPVR
jgi:methylase of polypeptide subunit release factors